MSQYTSIQEAIKNGCRIYWDEEYLDKGRSGGQRCPKCKIWIQMPRKRKIEQPVWLMDCEKCEIKDPFRRMWHQFNFICSEDERKLHNQWLSEVRELSFDLQFFPDGYSDKKMELQKLIQKIPFFEGIINDKMD